MADVLTPVALPPHLRAKATAHLKVATDMNKHEQSADTKVAVARTLPAREQKNKPEQAGSLIKGCGIMSTPTAMTSSHETNSTCKQAASLTKTHGVKVLPSAVASSTAPTSKGPSTYLRLEDLKKQFGTFEQATDGPDKKMSSKRGRANRRGNRTHGIKNKRNSTWAHNKDIPKGNDGRWDTNWDCPDIGGPAICKTNSSSVFGNDQRAIENVPELNDWDGGWAPAPLNWDSRPAFRSGQSALLIKGWMVKADKALGSGALEYPVPTTDVQKVSCDIAPRFWIPEDFGKQPRQTFWHEIIKSEPRPLDVTDLETAKPWWETYNSIESPLLQAYTTPNEMGVNPDDENLDERLARENDNGSASHAKNRVEFERAKRDAAETQRRKISAKERRLKQMLAEQHQQHDMVSHPPIKPRIKLYVRLGRMDDLPTICKIYNFYISQTCSSPKTRPVDIDQMTERIRDIQNQKLPFIVACARGESIKAGRRKDKRYDQEGVVLPDVVVGFSLVDCYSDVDDAYRYCVKVELYTSSSHYRKGVANCLMDKLIACLDPHYTERGGYEVTDEKLDCVEPERTVQAIMISIPHDDSSQLRMRWTSKWLIDKFGFEHVGDFHGIGVKHGQKINVFVLQRNTGAVIDLANPPDVLSKPS